MQNAARNISSGVSHRECLERFSNNLEFCILDYNGNLDFLKI